MVQRIDSSDPFHKGFLSYVIPQKENGWGKTALKVVLLLPLFLPLGILDLVNYGLDCLIGRVSHPPKGESEDLSRKVSEIKSKTFVRSDELIEAASEETEEPVQKEIAQKIQELNTEAKFSANFPEENLSKGFKAEKTREQDIKKQIDRDTKPYRESLKTPPQEKESLSGEQKPTPEKKKSGMIFIRVGDHVATSYDDLLVHLLFRISSQEIKDQKFVRKRDELMPSEQILRSEEEEKFFVEFFEKVIGLEDEKKLVEEMFKRELKCSKDAVLALFNQAPFAEFSSPLMQKFPMSRMDGGKDITIYFDPAKKSVSYKFYFLILDEDNPEITVANVQIEATYFFLEPEKSFQKYTLVDPKSS